MNFTSATPEKFFYLRRREKGSAGAVIASIERSDDAVNFLRGMSAYLKRRGAEDSSTNIAVLKTRNTIRINLHADLFRVTMWEEAIKAVTDTSESWCAAASVNEIKAFNKGERKALSEGSEVALTIWPDICRSTEAVAEADLRLLELAA